MATAGEQLIQNAILAELANQEDGQRLYVWVDPRDKVPTVDGEIDVTAMSVAIADSLRRTYGLDL